MTATEETRALVEAALDRCERMIASFTGRMLDNETRFVLQLRVFGLQKALDDAPGQIYAGRRERLLRHALATVCAVAEACGEEWGTAIPDHYDLEAAA